MVIKFEIHVDGGSAAGMVQARAIADPNLPTQKELSPAFNPPPGGGGPNPGPPATDPHPGSGPPGFGSGTVLVIGPIVICGSGLGPVGPGPGSGPPGGDGHPK